ncbi:hypothetical protein BD626DRAFT_572406 [Schizophyllum amplum]|uniref:Uncharacterized protein n=1 Tax=Schizophyllum amplum TaxID=97359 RepID=A0A550C4M3_9AGAR|nr:hypothetical protein BD626DRAFT_572406 [Auriculariopsis ampla]
MFDMQEVKDVALYALGRPGALDTLHRISLCVVYDAPHIWADIASPRVCTRTQWLKEHGLQELPLPAVAAIVRPWEELPRDECPIERQKIASEIFAALES